MTRVALFVDGANMFYSQKKLGWFIDYKKILQYFTDGKEIYNAFYYTGARIPPEARAESFKHALTYMGYTVRTKNIKQIIDDETGETIEKSNLDIEIVIDMFDTVNNYDLAILFSGDGDFERAVELIRSKGKIVYVVSTPGMIAYELVNAADKYIDLQKIKQEVYRAVTIHP